MSTISPKHRIRRRKKKSTQSWLRNTLLLLFLVTCVLFFTFRSLRQGFKIVITSQSVEVVYLGFEEQQQQQQPTRTEKRKKNKKSTPSKTLQIQRETVTNKLEEIQDNNNNNNDGNDDENDDDNDDDEDRMNRDYERIERPPSLTMETEKQQQQQRETAQIEVVKKVKPKDTTNQSEETTPVVADDNNEEKKSSVVVPFSNCKTIPDNNSTFDYCLPKIIVGGAMKCGTNEVGTLLAHHPRTVFKLCPPKTKCTADDYQGIRIWKSEDISLWETRPWFLSQGKIKEFMIRFPKTDGVTNITIDKGPSFLNTLLNAKYPSLAKTYLPGVKFIFAVCDPAERLASEFFHNQRDERLRNVWAQKFASVGLENRNTLPDFVDYAVDGIVKCQGNEMDCHKIRENVLSNGWYAQQIQDWFQEFSPTDILIVDMQGQSRTETAKQILQFADLPLDEYPWEKVNDDAKSYANTNAANYTGRDSLWNNYPQTMKKLSCYYKDRNQQLATLLNATFPLEWKSTTFQQATPCEKNYI